MKKKIVLLFILMLFIPVTFSSATLITVQDTTAQVNQHFLVNITCLPSEPIKAYEMKIRYDPRILSATSLSSGDFFMGKPTFSSPNCVINNTQGTIINVYDLTIGRGEMVIDPGVLLRIHFTANQNGTTVIELYDAGVTNDTMYLPLSITNGTVTISGVYDASQPGQNYYEEEQQKQTNPIPGLSDILIVLVIGAVIIFLFTRLT